MEDKNSTVIGSYSTRDEALSVIERLRNEGYDRDDIVIYTTDEAATRLGFDGLSGIDVETDENRMDGEEDRSLWERIKDTFSFDTYDSETATPENDPLYQYRGDISAGKFVITVKGYRQPETTEDTMDTQDTVSPASTMGTGLGTGTGTDPMDVDGTTGFQNTTDPYSQGTDENLEDDTITIPIKEEQVDVSKHTVVREEVGIHKEEHEDVEKVTEDVSREELDIDTSGDVHIEDRNKKS
ncbi:MAG: general stress protein [Enterococcus faecium]|nr:general stress protein [Enterococcus faecium]